LRRNGQRLLASIFTYYEGKLGPSQIKSKHLAVEVYASWVNPRFASVSHVCMFGGLTPRNIEYTHLGLTRDSRVSPRIQAPRVDPRFYITCNMGLALGFTVRPTGLTRTWRSKCTPLFWSRYTSVFIYKLRDMGHIDVFECCVEELYIVIHKHICICMSYI